MEFLRRINQTKNSNGTGGWANNSHSTQRGGAGWLHSLDMLSSLKYSVSIGMICIFCVVLRDMKITGSNVFFFLSTIMVFGKLCSKFFSNGILTSETQNSENSLIRLKSANANTLRDCIFFHLAPSCFVL